jgi:hypothetical protein
LFPFEHLGEQLYTARQLNKVLNLQEINSNLIQDISDKRKINERL